MSRHEIIIDTLPNGLTLIGHPSRSHQSAAIGFFVKTGARDETAKEAGVSHFLEHMMFKGTKKRSALDITFDLGNLGAQANAFTSEENTVYYAAIIPEYFSEMQELLTDMLRPALRQDDFDTEKKVILEEIALYQDRPHYYLFEHAFKDFYGENPAGNSVLGSTGSISALQRDEMQGYFDMRYSPSNMAIVAAGNFDFDLFQRTATQLCSQWKSANVSRKISAHTTPLIQKEYRKKNLSQSHVLLMSAGASIQDEERYAMGVLSMILGDSTGSKLYWELIDKGLADSAGADNEERDGTGAFMVYASTEPRRLDEVTSIIQRILKDPLDFSEADLIRARTKYTSRVVLNGEVPLSRLMSMGLEWNARRKVETLREIVERLERVDRAEIEKALSRYPLTTWAEFRLVPE